MGQGDLPPQPRGVGSLTPFTAPLVRAFLRKRGIHGIRDELRPDGRVVLRSLDRSFGARLIESDCDAPKEHVGDEGFVLDVQADATAPCRVRLDSGEVVSVKPKWLSKIEPLDPALATLFGKYGERAKALLSDAPNLGFARR